MPITVFKTASYSTTQPVSRTSHTNSGGQSKRTACRIYGLSIYTEGERDALKPRETNEFYIPHLQGQL